MEFQNIQLQNNLIYIDIYTTDKNGTNAVYYSTKVEDSGQTFGEGVVRLCTHKYKNEDGNEVLFEADAFYNKGGSPNSGEDIPVIFRRDQSGTDAFVLGMEENAEDIKTMKKELLRGFFYAIYMELLDVIICGEEFTKANIAEKMLEYVLRDCAEHRMVS